MIEIASLSGDLIISQLLKIRCQRVIQQNLMPANVPNEIRDVIIKYGDEVVR